VRSDIWGFECVLYEMATGRKAFAGKSYSSMVGAILAADPAQMEVKPFTPVALERLVRRCLAKDPEDRWQSMRDVVLELESIATAPVEAPVAAQPRRRWLLVAGAVAIAVIASTSAWLLQPTPPRTRFELPINPPPKTRFIPAVAGVGGMGLSPDGSAMAFSAITNGKMQLWVRRLDSMEARLLPGTEGAYYPFWSPDAAWIAFSASGRLMKIPAAGGPAQTLCNLAGNVGGDWSEDGVILFASQGLGIQRIEAGGGTPVAVTAFDSRRLENSHN